MSRKWILMIVALVLILAVAAAPIISMVIASAIADASGCVLHEGFRNPCVIGGEDYGDTLYAMSVSAWYMLVTMPAGIVAFLIWLIIAVPMAKTGRKAERA